MIAVIGAGAMGTALGMHVARANPSTVLLATTWDGAVVDAWRAGKPHPALGLTHPALPCRPYEEWDADLGQAETIIVAVSSDGLRDVLVDAVPRARPDATWVIATKGWQPDTLESPCDVATALLGTSDRVVSLAGPGLAPEIAVGAPTVLVCASRRADSAQSAARILSGPNLSTITTDDVVGAETGSAYKNVVAVAVGLCEGFSERLVERGAVHEFANARAVVFALGLIDMARLGEQLGGRADTVLGLAGAGDLYVTCLGGRNGRFGRLLGAGQTPEQARKVIGSTVEGVANCAAALAIAKRESIDLPSARAVEAALAQKYSDTEDADEIARLLVTGLAEEHERAQATILRR
jgi:glycerol-3-phosphate dehydrogenase (NAD(P)+)